VCTHVGSGRAEVAARHDRKQLVFDLVVQPAEEQVDEPAAAHIA
jgi:hypothetical protein